MLELLASSMILGLNLFDLFVNLNSLYAAFYTELEARQQITKFSLSGILILFYPFTFSISSLSHLTYSFSYQGRCTNLIS